jgi:hypothetical protein
MSSAIQLPLPGDPFALFALKRAGFQMLRIRRYVFDELWMALARAEKVAQVEHISRTQRATARFGYRMAKPNRTKLNASFSISKCRLCRLCQCRHGSVDVRTIKLGAGKALIVKGPNSQANRL